MELEGRGLCILLCYSVFMLRMIHNSLSLLLPGNEIDKLSLLAFKAQITSDPFNILSSWNQSLHFCEWHGVTCGRRNMRVVELDLTYSHLIGSLSPHIGNLSFLRSIRVSNNSFFGEIPQDLSRLFRLQKLYLGNNSFVGEIPVNVSRCSNLQLLDLGNNNLTGKLPAQIGSMSKMQEIYVYENQLVGEIPDSLGNLTSLAIFSGDSNGFIGGIPDSIGQLKRLSGIALDYNNLGGTIPSSLFNQSSLVHFSADQNQLHGSLPSDIGQTLPNLEFFSIWTNNFTGQVPITFSNASNLSVLQLTSNKFTGQIPNLSRLNNLQYLVVSHNQLGNSKEGDLDFLYSLANKTNLQALEIHYNNFGGMLPNILSNFSTQLETLNIQENQIQGNIPTEIGNLIDLGELNLGGNQLTGTIPSSIGKLKNLIMLYLYGNKLSGTIPSSLGNLTSLEIIYLPRNYLNGSIPASLGNCHTLVGMDLSQNNLSGNIPKEVLSLTSMSLELSLAMNELTGSLPLEVGMLVSHETLNLANNKLSSNIPETLGSCEGLVLLYLEGNSFEGMIPQSMSLLKGLQVLNLSHNNLTGQIPMFMENFQVLESLDLSFNDLEGEVSTQGIFKNASAISVQGNKKLCGGISQLNLERCTVRKSKSSTKPILIATVASAILGVILLSFVFYIYCKNKKKKQISNLGILRNVSLRRVTYEDLLKATNGFSPTNLVGRGSFGTVYKGILRPDDKVVAVKVLNLRQKGAFKSFVTESEILTSTRHRNLLPMITACSSTDFQGNDFKALVYEFMTGGNLEEWLHGGQSSNLNLIQRLNIAIDVASAVDYLHCQCSTPIVHCHLKPSNILLDSDMTAHVGDFGLARIINATSYNSSMNQSSSVAIEGTIGYAAPEYAMRSEVSTWVDVYSYGILLLEMFTGRRPTDDIFSGDLNLHKFVKLAIPNSILEVFDPVLVKEVEEKLHNATGMNSERRQRLQECLDAIIKIGVDCSTEMPSDRLDMSKVAAELKKVRNSC